MSNTKHENSNVTPPNVGTQTIILAISANLFGLLCYHAWNNKNTQTFDEFTLMLDFHSKHEITSPVLSRSENVYPTPEKVGCDVSELRKKLTIFDFKQNITWDMVQSKNSEIINRTSSVTKHTLFESTALFQPLNCDAEECMAILIPARNREYHLQQLMFYLPDLLVNQRACFGIYVLDQYNNNTIFNKAKLFNAGIIEAKKDRKWDCFVFHDVDMLSQNETVLYKCDEKKPRHLSVAIDKYNYGFNNIKMVGGVTLMTDWMVEAVNGWSNSFWGWGAEDDNMYYRLQARNLTPLSRPDFNCKHPGGNRFGINCGMWQMIKHAADETNPLNSHRKQHLHDISVTMDGLHQVEYVLKEKSLRNSLYSYMLFDLHAPLLEEYQKTNEKKNKDDRRM